VGRKCKTGGCSYEHWSRAKHAMVHCGRKEDRLGSALCAFHQEWVKDCTGTWSKRRGGHPEGYDWLKKARMAYGCKGSALLHMLPSDAGKMPQVWGTC
jgi:hypothetical protein